MTDEQPPRPSWGDILRDDVARLDREGLHALAHPLRIRIVAVLRRHGPATATRLATRLGTNSGATSYHLRQLEAAGLVTEDRDRGTARERWWRAVHRATNFTEVNFADDPDDLAAVDWLTRHMTRQHAAWAEDWVEARASWPEIWREAADLSDYWLHLTPEQLTALSREVFQTIERYRTAADADDPRAERVVLVWEAFPSPEPRL